MANFQKFQQFVEDLAHGVHDLANDQLAIALTNSAPDGAADAVLADITEIDYSNLSSRNATTTGSGQTDGTYALALDDLVLTASGEVGPFRYVVLYNDTPAEPADPLIGYWDYGESITLQNGETFTVDFGASVLTLA